MIYKRTQIAGPQQRAPEFNRAVVQVKYITYGAYDPYDLRRSTQGTRHK